MKKLIYLTFGLSFVLFSCKEDPDILIPPSDVASTEMYVYIDHLCNDSDIVFVNGTYTLPAGEEVHLNRLAYILSGFYLVDENQEKLHLEDQYALVEPKNGNKAFTLKNIPKGNYTALGFSLGLDSSTNHGNPNQYDINHPLSPVNNGLYWNWAGGYVFIAMEGKLENSTESYVYHIAGVNNKISYELPFSFTKTDHALTAELNMNFEEIFKSPALYEMAVDGMSTHSETAPNTLKLVENMGDMFEIKNISE